MVKIRSRNPTRAELRRLFPPGTKTWQLVPSSIESDAIDGPDDIVIHTEIDPIADPRWQQYRIELVGTVDEDGSITFRRARVVCPDTAVFVEVLWGDGDERTEALRGLERMRDPQDVQKALDGLKLVRESEWAKRRGRPVGPL